MTRIVGIDTATPMAEIACVEIFDEPGSCPSERALVRRGMERSHAIHLTALLDEALSEAGWGSEDPDCWVAVRGPGSFTGIRIALGAVKGLAYASGKPVLGVDRLVAMAHRARTGVLPRVPLMAAGRGEVYMARYGSDGSPPRQLEAPAVVSPEWLSKHAVPSRIIVDGPIEGIELPESLIVETLSGGVAVAAAMLAMDAEFLRRDGAPCSPLYIRPSDAELKRRA